MCKENSIPFFERATAPLAMSVNIQSSHQGHPAAPPQVSQEMFRPPQAGNLASLRYQLEFYFSPQNLGKDKYLLGQLTSPHHRGAVPMGVICNFPKVRQINAFLYNMGHLSGPMAPPADPNLVRMALHRSPIVSVTEDGAWLVPVDASAWIQAQQKVDEQQQTNGSAGGPSGGDVKVSPSAPSSPSSQATTSSSLGGIPTHPLPPAVAQNQQNNEIPKVTNDGAQFHNVVRVVVQGVPETATVQEVVATFRLGDAPEPPALRTGVDSWELHFPDEAAAGKVMAASEGKTVQGCQVRAYIQNYARPVNIDQNYNGASGIATPQPVPMGYPNGMHAGYPLPMQPASQFMSYGYSHPVPQPMHMSPAFSQQLYNFPPTGYNPTMMRQPYPGHTRQIPPQHPNNAVRHQHAQHKNNNNNNQRGRGQGAPDSNSNRRNMVKNWQPKTNGNRPGKPQDPATNSAGAPRSGNKNNNKRNNTKQKKGDLPPKKSEAETIDLGAEHFPALGGKIAVDAPNAKVANVPTGYAAALRKNVESLPHGKPTSASEHQAPTVELEKAMGKLTFSEDGTEATACDDW